MEITVYQGRKEDTRECEEVFVIVFTVIQNVDSQNPAWIALNLLAFISKEDRNGREQE